MKPIAHEMNCYTLLTQACIAARNTLTLSSSALLCLAWSCGPLVAGLSPMLRERFSLPHAAATHRLAPPPLPQAGITRRRHISNPLLTTELEGGKRPCSAPLSSLPRPGPAEACLASLRRRNARTSAPFQELIAAHTQLLLDR